MISFLIPVYNRDVNTLVNELFDQCKKLNIEFEILVYDDYSLQKYRDKNAVLASKSGVGYIELSKNMGRSKIRNWLAKNARFDTIVFLDCDQFIRHRTFVQKYIKHMDGADVLYGGTTYKKKKPGKSKILHWTYGRKVEAQPARKRKRNPYLSFRSNNFLIKRDLFLKFRFEEQLTSYGHEDTLLALQLEEHNILIQHLDNPVEHAGLEKNEVFLDKTNQAIEHLPVLIDQGVKTRLVRFYSKLNRSSLLQVLLIFRKPLERWINQSIYSEKPSMTAFQLYKLFRFIDLKKKQEG